MAMPKKTRFKFYQYGAAIVVVILATVVRYILDPVMAEAKPLVTYLPVIMLCAWLFGSGPTLVSLFLALAMAIYFFIPPRHSFTVDKVSDQVGLFIFMIFGLIAALFSEQFYRAKERGHLKQLQRETDHALRESEERFRQLADSMPQLVWTIGPDGQPDYYNERFYEYTGLPKGENAEKLWASGVHPDDVEWSKAAWLEAVESGRLFQMVFRVKDSRTGEYRWHLGRAVPNRDEAGQIVQWVGTSTDIDEQKRIEEKLRESERLYRAIGESIDYGVWVCNPDGKNIYASPSFLRLVGLTPDQCSEFGWKEVLHPDDAERTLASWKECVRTRGKWDIEHRVRGVDGQWHTILARGAPVEDEQGNVLCWAGINLDIGRLKKAEEELQQARDELDQRVKERTLELTQANQRIRRLASQLATAEDTERRRLATDLHDSIGQSLSLLKMNLEPLRDQSGENGSPRQALTTSLQLLDDVIKQTRTLMFDLYPSMLHDLGLVPTLRWHAEQLAAQAQVSVTEIGQPQNLPAPVLNSLFRAAKELLSNAVRHGRAREIIVVVHWRRDVVKIVIDDDGSGFDPEKVLTPHAQHGLGLAGIQERLVSLSGRMFIESNPGQGSRIALEVPLSGSAEDVTLETAHA